MRIRMWWIATLFTAASVGFLTAENGSSEDDAPVETVSVMIGGLVTLDTGYIIASGTYSADRLSYYGETIVDIGFPTWSDGSSGEYYHIGGEAGLRLTAINGGRGLLAGVGLGGGYSWLTVTDAGSATALSDWQIGITPHVGVRFGNESGIFGEAVMRLMLPLREIFIYAGETPPDTTLDGRYSIFRYQAVYMPAAIAVGRFYLGVGYAFTR